MQKDFQKTRLRFGATVYYAIVCCYAVYRFVLTLLGRTPADKMTYLHITTFGFFILTSWCLVGILNALSDRIAAVLLGLFYVVRIGMHFVNGHSSVAILLGIGCAISLSGMVAMIVGMIPAISRPAGPGSF